MNYFLHLVRHRVKVLSYMCYRSLPLAGLWTLSPGDCGCLSLPFSLAPASLPAVTAHPENVTWGELVDMES